MITARGLTEARIASRILLALGGAATIAVAALPQPAAGHVPAATTGFILLALWPALSIVPSRALGLAATFFLTVLLAWLVAETDHGSLLGLTERLVAGAEALWPLVVVSLVRRH